MSLGRFSIFGLISLAIIINLACQSENTETFQEVSTPNPASPRDGGTDLVTSEVPESAGTSPKTAFPTKVLNPSPTPASLAKFAGFDFQLREGVFWEYKWEYKSSTFCRDCRGGPTTGSGTFRVTLGLPKVIEGVTAYEVHLVGKHRLEGSSTDRSFAPRWRYMAQEDSRILVSEDGVTLVVLFDGQEGEWPGSGFFTTRFKAKDLYERKVSGRDVVVSASSRTGGCRYFRSVGQVCPGGTSTDYTEREVYSPGIGPVEYSFRYSSSSGSGTTSFSSSTSEKVELVASSLRGDSASSDLKAAPDNTQVTRPSAAPAASSAEDLSTFERQFVGLWYYLRQWDGQKEYIRFKTDRTACAWKEPSGSGSRKDERAYAHWEIDESAPIGENRYKVSFGDNGDYYTLELPSGVIWPTKYNGMKHSKSLDEKTCG